LESVCRLYLVTLDNSIQNIIFTYHFRRIDGLCKKFNVSSQQELAEEFKEKTEEYLTYGEEEDSRGREDIDIEYSVMHFLLAVSQNPVNKKYERKFGSQERLICF